MCYNVLLYVTININLEDYVFISCEVNTIVKAKFIQKDKINTSFRNKDKVVPYVGY